MGAKYIVEQVANGFLVKGPVQNSGDTGGTVNVFPKFLLMVRWLAAEWDIGYESAVRSKARGMAGLVTGVLNEAKEPLTARAVTAVLIEQGIIAEKETSHRVGQCLVSMAKTNRYGVKRISPCNYMIERSDVAPADAGGET